MSFSKWKYGKLKDLAVITMGQSPSSEFCNKEKKGIPLLNGPTEFGLKHPFPVQYTTIATKTAQPEDILFCVRGSTTGRMNWADQEYAIGRGVAAITPLDKRSACFVKALLDLNLNILLQSATGSTFPNVSKPMLENLPVIIPPLNEQRAISRMISLLDDKIELNNRINKILEEMEQAIFKSWFVDFEPFRDAEFEDSELGEIPKGWKVGTISDLGEVVGGSTPSKKNPGYYTEKGIPWITPKDLSENRRKYISRGAIDITEEGYRSCSTRLMPKGTVLFSSRAPIGYVAVAKNDVTTNQGFKSIVPKKHIGTEYVYYFLKFYTELIESRASGSTFKEISGSEMKKIPALIPDNETLASFNRVVNALGEQMRKGEEENDILINIRDNLLPKLMSGEIRVPVDIPGKEAD